MKRVELDLVAVEVDALCDLKCSSDSLVIVQRDDHAAHPLVIFSDLLLDTPFVSLDLSDHRITTRSSTNCCLCLATPASQRELQYVAPHGDLQTRAILPQRNLGWKSGGSGANLIPYSSYEVAARRMQPEELITDLIEEHYKIKTKR